MIINVELTSEELKLIRKALYNQSFYHDQRCEPFAAKACDDLADRLFEIAKKIDR